MGPRNSAKSNDIMQKMKLLTLVRESGFYQQAVGMRLPQCSFHCRFIAWLGDCVLDGSGRGGHQIWVFLQIFIIPMQISLIPSFNHIDSDHAFPTDVERALITIQGGCLIKDSLSPFASRITGCNSLAYRCKRYLINL